MLIGDEVLATCQRIKSLTALSTGPRTPEGKLASSRNSLKHGLATGALIIPGEDPSAFETLRDTLLREHQPANAIAEMLVNEVAVLLAPAARSPLSK